MEENKTKIVHIVMASVVILCGVFMIGADSFVQASDHDEYLYIDTRGELSLVVEVLIGLFALTSIALTSRIVRKLSGSAFFSSFVFMLAGLVLLYLTRVMYIIYEFRILDIGDETLDLWWHLIFYMGMTCFLIVLHKLTGKPKDTKRERESILSKKELSILVTFGILPALLFLSAESLDAWFLSWFRDSVIDEIGLQHFIAFVFAGFIALRLVLLRFFGRAHNEKSMMQPFLVPFSMFLVFLILLSLNHFWELLTESWRIMRLPENVIETTEQFFWLSAFGFVAYGLLRNYKKMVKVINNLRI